METYQRHSVANQHHVVFTEDNEQFLANCLGVSSTIPTFSRESHRWHHRPPQEVPCAKCSKKTRIYYDNRPTCKDCHPDRPVLQSIIYPETECAKCKATKFATHRQCSKHLAPLRKEYVVNMFLFDAHLENRLKVPFVANKTYKKTKYRPDIVLEFSQGEETLTIIVEIDEGGHNTYDMTKDSERTKKLLSLAGHLILIRYNPDKIANGITVSVADRCEALLNAINEFSTAKYKKPLMCYMFYETAANKVVPISIEPTD